MLDLHEIERILRARSELEMDYHFRPLTDDKACEFKPLVSSRVRPKHWARIARTIERYYKDYDGFVVLHGTDTMAWTASALSFMFTNLSKPIVLTGSQRPIKAAPSDAVANFVNSVVLAGRGHESIPVIPEVLICFGDVVLRGNRSTKISAASMQGFGSPNASPLGRVGRRFEISDDQLRTGPAADDAFFVRHEVEKRVADILLYPGMKANQLANALDGNVGAVLRTFGAGNSPWSRKIEAVLRAACSEGKVLVNVTQCNEGLVESGMLTGSRALADCGVVSGLDMTPEAAFTKLVVLLGSNSPATVREQIQLDQRGEQSMDLVEMQASGQRPDDDGVTRLVLTPALHARADVHRLTSAVLRLRCLGSPAGQPTPTGAILHVNRLRAGRSTPPDTRTICTELPWNEPDCPPKMVTIDVTELGRQVLQPGSPVTVNIVPNGGRIEVDALLSLFLEHGNVPTRQHDSTSYSRRVGHGAAP